MLCSNLLLSNIVLFTTVSAPVLVVARVIFLQTLRPMFDQPTPVKQPFKQPVLHNKSDDIAFRTDHLSTVYGFNAKVAFSLAVLTQFHADMLEIKTCGFANQRCTDIWSCLLVRLSI